MKSLGLTQEQRLVRNKKLRRIHIEKNRGMLNAKRRVREGASIKMKESKRQESKRQWNKNNRAKRNTVRNERRRTDPQFALTDRLRCRLHKAMRNMKFRKTASTQKLLGCTWDHAVGHLETNDRGLKITDKDIHIDHIRPLSSFKNLQCEFEQRTSCHYLNLQLLPAKENQQKHASFDYDSWAASDAGKQLLELNREWRMERYFQ
jgi:hypothetical protein